MPTRILAFALMVVGLANGLSQATQSLSSEIEADCFGNMVCVWVAADSVAIERRLSDTNIISTDILSEYIPQKTLKCPADGRYYEQISVSQGPQCPNRHGATTGGPIPYRGYWDSCGGS